mmetsp:Transcript_70873/g.207662  ORF Transcript_70873/g.207662 Transcript_70873/m.207662 type:complete len:210 (-) Transcript_70873:43-672(-)
MTPSSSSMPRLRLHGKQAGQEPGACCPPRCPRSGAPSWRRPSPARGAGRTSLSAAARRAPAARTTGEWWCSSPLRAWDSSGGRRGSGTCPPWRGRGAATSRPASAGECTCAEATLGMRWPSPRWSASTQPARPGPHPRQCSSGEANLPRLSWQAASMCWAAGAPTSPACRPSAACSASTLPPASGRSCPGSCSAAATSSAREPRGGERC